MIHCKCSTVVQYVLYCILQYFTVYTVLYTVWYTVKCTCTVTLITVYCCTVCYCLLLVQYMYTVYCRLVLRYCTAFTARFCTCIVRYGTSSTYSTRTTYDQTETDIEYLSLLLYTVYCSVQVSTCTMYCRVRYARTEESQEGQARQDRRLRLQSTKGRFRPLRTQPYELYHHGTVDGRHGTYTLITSVLVTCVVTACSKLVEASNTMFVW